MDGKTHAQITRAVLKAFGVRSKDVEAGVDGAVLIDEEFRKLGAGTWAIAHSFNDSGRLVPALETDSVGNSDLGTIRVSHHLGGVYALLAYHALPTRIGWYYLGGAQHLAVDLCTPPHTGAMNWRNLLESLFKSGHHHQFELFVAESAELMQEPIEEGIKEALALKSQPLLADEVIPMIQDQLLPVACKWTVLQQEKVYRLMDQIRAGVEKRAALEELLKISQECVKQGAFYSAWMTALIGVKPSEGPDVTLESAPP